MFPLTSNATKISVLTLCAFLTLIAMDSMALGFQLQSRDPVVVTLPTVTVIGHRAELMQDAVQTAVESHSNTSI